MTQGYKAARIQSRKEASRDVQAYLDWWTLAGLSAPVGEAPADWLRRESATVSWQDAHPPADPLAHSLARERIAQPDAVQPDAVQPDSAALVPLSSGVASLARALPAMPCIDFPGEWSAFQQWLAQAPEVPGAQWQKPRILPTGPQNAPLMIVSACPEKADYKAGHLLAGDAGKLTARMLRAIGLAKDECYIASIAMTRPLGARLDSASEAELSALLWHHIKLAKPKRLLILGNDAARIIAQDDLAAVNEKLLHINRNGLEVSAVAIPHPDFLLGKPERKANVWKSLKLLIRK